MTATKPTRTCDECKWDGGWHYDDNGHVTRCPNWYAAEQAARVQVEIAANQREAFEAAKKIVADVANSRFEFSANALHPQMEAAQIPGSLVGAAFNACHKAGLIEPTDRFEMSDDPDTRHRLRIWRSRVFRLAAS